MKKEEILEKLKEVVDPEIGINIVDLGLIYNIEEKNGKIHILMTLTTPFCPLGNFILDKVREVLKDYDFELELTFDPPWTPERINPEVRKKLEVI